MHAAYRETFAAMTLPAACLGNYNADNIGGVLEASVEMAWCKRRDGSLGVWALLGEVFALLESFEEASPNAVDQALVWRPRQAKLAVAHEPTARVPASERRQVCSTPGT